MNKWGISVKKKKKEKRKTKKSKARAASTSLGMVVFDQLLLTSRTALAIQRSFIRYGVLRTLRTYMRI